MEIKKIFYSLGFLISLFYFPKYNMHSGYTYLKTNKKTSCNKKTCTDISKLMNLLSYCLKQDSFEIWHQRKSLGKKASLLPRVTTGLADFFHGLDDFGVQT